MKLDKLVIDINDLKTSKKAKKVIKSLKPIKSCAESKKGLPLKKVRTRKQDPQQSIEPVNKSVFYRFLDYLFEKQVL
jgi:hypothetical protein